MRLIPLFLLATSVAIADTRSDLDKTLAALTGRDTIHARIDIELSNWASDDKSPPVNGGKASVRLAATDDGLSVHWDRQQLEAALGTGAGAAEDADSKRRAMASLSVPQLVTYLNIARDIAQIIDGAEVISEEANAPWKGRPARLLTLKLKPKLSEKNRKYIKQIDATARLWLDADGVPIAAERSQFIKGRAMLVIGFEAKESEQYEFARAGDRLVVTRHTKEGSGAGAGESNRFKSTAILTIEEPAARSTSS